MSGWRLAKALIELRSEVNVAHPSRSTTSDGTIGDVRHRRNSSSRHNPNDVGVVLAWDCTSPVGHEVAEWLRAKRDPRIRLVISNRQLFSAYNHASGPAWEWRPYSGSNPHETHAHIQVDDSRHLYDDDSPWGYQTVQSHEEADVLKRGDNGDEVTYLQQQVNRVLTGRHDTGPLTIDGDFGPGTEQAVKDAQTKLGWTPTGTATAQFCDRMLHVVLYGDISRLDTSGQGYAADDHTHTGTVTLT